MRNFLREKKAETSKPRQDDEPEFEINPLFQKDADGLRRPKKHRGKVTLGADDENLNLGDTVQIVSGADDDGEEGIVRLINAPGNTVGVMIGGELQMYDSKEVRRVKESFALDLSRIQQLAGLGAEVADQPAAIEVTMQPVTVTGVEPADETASGVHYALDEIERLIPKVQVKDLKGIRQRLSAVNTRMNETKQPSRRPGKSFRDYLGEAEPQPAKPPSATIKPTYAAGGKPPLPAGKPPQTSPMLPAQTSASSSPTSPSSTNSSTNSSNSNPTTSTSTHTSTGSNAPVSGSGRTSLGRNRHDAVKSLADRLGGDQQTAGRMLDAMSKDGVVKQQNGEFAMDDLDDEMFQAHATLAKGR